MDSPPTKPERTSRKRLTDRRAQRNRRERVKAYIANLEKTVQELTEAAGDSSNSAMLKRLEEKRAEIADLTDLLKQIHTITADVLDSDLAVCSPVAMSRDMTLDHLMSCHGGFGNYFAVVNDSLQTLLASSEMSSAENADDIIIRMVLDGWNSAGEIKDLDRGWQLLRALDNGLFYRTGAVERLAILRVMRSTLVVSAQSQHTGRGYPTNFPLSLQPNMRDHLIMSMVSYIPEAAAAVYASQIKLKWPFELRDAYKYRAADGRYEFSSEFDRVYHDIESWGLGSDPTLNMLLTTEPGGELDSIDNSLDNALETEIRLYSE
ncbi:hypothetical protein BJY01DRAFT_263086 [Aspergillus pseudoustus]|uniref:BZIP domain-containing protein n=1 Tax=Aspergillus pseudoustus TaxID=1810923 RepID=A0ABR4K4C3_9EURO